MRSLWKALAAAAAIIITMIVIGVMTKANSQSVDVGDPTQNPSIPYTCQVLGALPANIEIKHVLSDNDGDQWITIRKRDTGRMMLGFSKQGMFCTLAEGRVNPEQ